MSRLQRSILSMLAGLSTVGVTTLHGQASLTAAHAALISDSVQQTLTAFTATMARARWDSAASFYSDRADFRWVEEGKVVARTAGEIRHYLTAMKPTMRITTTYANLETTALAPGVASVLTDFSTTMGDSGAAGFTFAGELTMTMVHQPDGWKILNGHSSAPH